MATNSQQRFQICCKDPFEYCFADIQTYELRFPLVASERDQIAPEGRGGTGLYSLSAICHQDEQLVKLCEYLDFQQTSRSPSAE